MRIEIPDSLLVLLQPARYKSIEGGRGSGKSHTVARILVAMAYSRTLRIFCGREIQKSIKRSVKQLLEDVIRGYGLGDQFHITNDEIVCKRTGSLFMFGGLRDHTADTIKSLEGVDIVWLEEAQRISKRSWQILTPTIRKEGSEIWATWNPDLEDDETYQRTWVKPWVPVANMIRVKINWSGNRWFPETLHLERLALQAANDDLYQHVWEGKLRSAAGLLFKRHWFENSRYDPEELPALNHMTRYMSSDYASADLEDLAEEGGDRDEPDFTEVGVWGMDEHEIIWGMDWWSGQTDPLLWIQAIERLFKVYRPARYYEESGVIYRATKGTFDKHMRRTKAPFVQREPLPSTGSKADRALGFAALAAAGRIRLPRGERWADDLVDQLCAFTGLDGKVDDKVDACSKFAQGLDSTSAPSLPKPRRRRTITPHTEAHIMGLYEDDDTADKRRRYHEV